MSSRVRATLVKTTKNNYRYDLIENDDGILGVIYLPQKLFGKKKPDKEIELKLLPVKT